MGKVVVVVGRGLPDVMGKGSENRTELEGIKKWGRIERTRRMKRRRRKTGEEEGRRAGSGGGVWWPEYKKIRWGEGK